MLPLPRHCRSLVAHAVLTSQASPPSSSPCSGHRQLEKALKKKNVKGVQAAYLKGLDVLDGYLDLVELPPVESGNYDKTFERGVGSSARIT